MKFGVLIDYNECYSKNKKIRDKRVWPSHVICFSILGSPQYFRNSESYELLKFVNGDDGNLREEPPSWSRGRAHNGREWRGRIGDPRN